MWCFHTCEVPALQLPHMLRARGWKKTKLNQTLKINSALHPSYMDILLSVHLSEAFGKLFQLGDHKQNVSFLVCSAGFFNTFSFYDIVCPLPRDTHLLFADPVRAGTIIYIFHSHRMTKSMDSVQRLEDASGDCLVQTPCPNQSQLQLFSAQCLVFLLLCKGKTRKHECPCGWLKEQDHDVRWSRPMWQGRSTLCDLWGTRLSLRGKWLAK